MKPVRAGGSRGAYQAHVAVAGTALLPVMLSRAGGPGSILGSRRPCLPGRQQHGAAHEEHRSGGGGHHP